MLQYHRYSREDLTGVLDGNSAVAERLTSTGIPVGEFVGWVELPRPIALDDGSVQLYREGDDALCVDPHSGDVFMLFRRSRRRGHINRSISTLAEIIEVVIQQYPIYSRTSDASALEDLAAELRRRILDIDDSCVRDTYWDNFLDDLLMGIYYENDQAH